ncbi:hypothetical protein PFISCL1PPCAC_3645, partial [Pristionchus fissidentatus]
PLPPPPPPCGCGAAAVAAAGSYATAAASSYTTGRNIARDDNLTVFSGTYDSNDSPRTEQPKLSKLPELSVPDKYTTYEEFQKFLAQSNHEDFSTLDEEPGISDSTSLRRSSQSGFKSYRDFERMRRHGIRRKEERRCTNNRLRGMIAEV